MRIALWRPEWDRSCADCEAWQYNRDGTLVRDRRTSLPLARPPGTPTPCTLCPKVPKNDRLHGWRHARTAAIDMSGANRQAWEFYRRCRATVRFPDDPVVAWYAGLIEPIVDEFESRHIERFGEKIDMLTVRLGKGR